MLAVIPATPYEYIDKEYNSRWDAASTDQHLPCNDGTPPHGVHPLTRWWTHRVSRYEEFQRAKG